MKGFLDPEVRHSTGTLEATCLFLTLIFGIAWKTSAGNIPMLNPGIKLEMVL